MKKYKVVVFRSTEKSFDWNDGLFAIYKQVDDIVHFCKIEDEKLKFYEDGSPYITCTGVNNKGIILTDMIIYENKK